MGWQMEGEKLGFDETGGDFSPALSCTTATLHSAVSLFKLFHNINNKDNDNAKNIEIPAMSHNSKSTKRGRTVKSLSEW